MVLVTLNYAGRVLRQREAMEKKEAAKKAAAERKEQWAAEARYNTSPSKSPGTQTISETYEESLG